MNPEQRAKKEKYILDSFELCDCVSMEDLMMAVLMNDEAKLDALRSDVNRMNAEKARLKEIFDNGTIEQKDMAIRTWKRWKA